MTNFGDHVLHPRNIKRLANPSGVGRAIVEGDTVFLQIAITAVEDVIVETAFESFFCGHAIGLCSVLTERIKGLSLAEAERLTAEGLLADFPEIPEGKRDYAKTAIEALRAALNEAQTKFTGVSK